MKAIHNILKVYLQLLQTVFNISKIQNESNSQLIGYAVKSMLYCVQYFKDTK